MDQYIKLSSVKPPYKKTKYPYNEVNEENVLFTQKEIELNYIPNLNYYIDTFEESYSKEKKRKNDDKKKGGKPEGYKNKTNKKILIIGGLF